MKIIFLISILLSSVSCKGQDKTNYCIETGDIIRFWKAYDSIQSIDSQEEKAKILTTVYFNGASESFKIALMGDVANPYNYLQSFEEYPKFWKSLKLPSLELAENIDGAVNEPIEKIKKAYPSFKAPNVCLFIGPRVVQGTVLENTIFLGLDLLVNHSKIDVGEFDESNRLIYQNDVESTIVHEMIHFNQKPSGNSLLSRAIREGSADFLAELITGKPFQSAAYNYGYANEKILWDDFLKEMYKNDFSKWIGGQSGNAGRPEDLGYFIGYMITRSYYENAIDKEKAIKEIIEFEADKAEEFLAKSNYTDKF